MPYALYYDAGEPVAPGTPRYYIVGIAGIGTLAWPFQANVPSLPNQAAVIPTDASGQPTNSWTLLTADIATEDRLLAMGGLRLPDPGDLTVSAPVKVAITALTGVDLSAASTGAQVIEALGSALEATFEQATMATEG